MKRTIDMVTRLYVYILKSDNEISGAEIEILYSLLINLFSQVDVSWETYVKEIVESEYKIEDVFVYLDRNLSVFDKIRLIQSLVIMAKTEADFAISDLTEIMELAKNLNISATTFLPLIDHFEKHTRDSAHIECRHHLSHVKHSVFSDYVVFGHGDQADVQYRDPRLSNYECAIFAIDKYMFLSVASGSNAILNGQKAEQNAIHLLNEDSVLMVAGREYCYSCLQKMYFHRDDADDIVFRKPEYEFIFRKFKSSFSIVVYNGVVTLNDKEMSHNRRYEVFYDDTLQIRNYAPFHLGMVIQDRAEIGVEDYLPQVLHIVSDKGYLHTSREDSENSVTRIEYHDDGFHIFPPRKGHKVFVNQQELIEPILFNLNTDTLTIDKKNYRINNFYDLIETPFEIESYVVTDIKHYFSDGVLALDSVSFEANKGQMVAILGQSGCGKSTLTNVLSSELTPSYGQIQIDGKSLYSNLSYFQEHIAYVPQGDLLYPNLSVYENLWYRIRLRMPDVQKEILEQKVNNILHQVNLSQHRDTIVGDFKKKNLSGGERKRLNLALELLFEPTIIICDEPTSGLSFNDAEHIIEILSNLCQQDKIVILTIHQPNSSIYRMFDRVLMMDIGGKIAFYGTPTESFSYFDDELAMLSVRKAEVEKKRHLLTSDYFYDIITYPLYDEAGQPVYEQIRKQVQAKRMFPPDYWRDKYKRKMLYELMQSDVQSLPVPDANMKRKAKRLKPKSYLVSMMSFISRSFKMKIRNRTNNFITFLQAPLLGLIISFILRHTTTGVYTYAENNNISIYIFVSIIAFIFLGMSNSIEEILSERKIILRERLMNLKASNYLFSKLMVLSFFGLIQAVLYHIIAALVLNIRGLSFINIFYFFLASLIGNSIGLLTSAFIKENRAIINFLPLILIPQIIFGGAVIEFERMNHDLKIYDKHPIPEVVQVVPSRWLFEGLATSYAKNTTFHKKLNKIQKKELTYLRDYRNATISNSQFQKKRTEIYYAKTNLAERWDPNRIVNSYLNSAVSIMDGKVLNSGKNEFLSSIKLVGGHRRKTWNFNALVIMFFALGLNLITWIKLKYYFKE
ncbi:MAG: ATP-binding cassette domain-containing protein [Candidatus Cloacimonetes bacterium]|nr:ATP-binding cassette domain-containing protein [Candidatus Cloacimonadota bacterium]